MFRFSTEPFLLGVLSLVEWGYTSAELWVDQAVTHLITCQCSGWSSIPLLRSSVNSNLKQQCPAYIYIYLLQLRLLDFSWKAGCCQICLAFVACLRC